MKDLNVIAANIASESSPDGCLDSLVRFSVMVTIGFGNGIWIVLIRDQALRVVRRVRVLELHYPPRQIVRSNIYGENDLVATFIMTLENGLAD